MEINEKVTTYNIGAHSSPGGTERVGKKQGQDVQNAEGKEATEQHAVVSLSRASKEAQLIQETMESENSVREDKVSELREKIESGKYTVHYDEVANKLVDASLEDLL